MIIISRKIKKEYVREHVQRYGKNKQRKRKSPYTRARARYNKSSDDIKRDYKRNKDGQINMGDVYNRRKKYVSNKIKDMLDFDGEVETWYVTDNYERTQINLYPSKPLTEKQLKKYNEKLKKLGAKHNLTKVENDHKDGRTKYWVKIDNVYYKKKKE
ncbi:MAG: hypothetical protein ACTSQ6_11395 [Candidatus Heimdallarchaeaceae archaeon]